MSRLKRAAKWLYPGLGVKRWLFVAWLGLLLFTLGMVLFVNWRVGSWIDMNLIGELHLRAGRMALPWLVYVAAMAVGVGLIIYGIRKWFASIYKVVMPYESKRLVDRMYERTALAHRFRIVAIGGGTGLSSLLRGLKAHTSNIVAVVTVSDDGGSSGRLRKDRGLLPPGDIRNCLVALADDDTLLAELLQYRFHEGGDLAGHSFGNLFLAALTEIAKGDFDHAIKMSGQILNIRGKVFPGTLHQTTLCAEYMDGTMVEGESEIPRHGKPIKRVWLCPDDCEPMDEVLQAIRDADAVILGPGSLFSSVIPNLLVQGMVDALERTRGLRIYVCNVMTQPGETDEYKASDHLKAIYAHTGRKIVDVALVNQEVPRLLLDRYKAEGAFPVLADLDAIERLGVRPVAANLINETNLVRHDSARLAEVVYDLILEYEENGRQINDVRGARRGGWLSRRRARPAEEITRISSL
ncbi:MAG: uridine diphosphate-N-acetylglucosamine-binding protein YvcK [Armatimonadetes bacterium]|nr:uridine diphosphate-N-acetylglucosamine-binding protein YvcK [Armatimonadota bacterium]